ncbi:hypothetical protein D3C72_99960 [compost metagenome]
MASADTSAQDELDPIKVTILRNLWEASQDSSASAWSLAKLSKRSCIPMSTLRRTLSEFEDAGIVDVTTHEDGRVFAALNATGIEIFPSLFSTQ